jgi:transcription elongation GreA/GreB family factor
MSTADNHSDKNLITKKDTVRVRFANGAIKEFKFAAIPAEVDPSNGQISTECPLGRTLLGASVGEKRKYEVLGKEIEVEILEIKKQPEGSLRGL